MRILHIFIVLSILAVCSNIFAQDNLNIRGVVLDATGGNPLPGATVLVRDIGDTLKTEGSVSDLKGVFILPVTAGKHALTISFLGYRSYTDTIVISNNPVNIGTVRLYEEAEQIEEVKVISNLAPVLQRGDTTAFNPDAYKVNLDATAGDLILKMPGFYSEEGKLMAMGDTVVEVLMDGKKLFGENIDEALEMIPPNIIKKVEVYQYKSEGEKHSGFNESTEGKTVNIKTNRKAPGLMKSEVAVGYGKDNRYVGEGRYNNFQKERRIGINANANNINVPIKINRGREQSSISGDKTNNHRFMSTYGKSGKTELSANYFFNNNKTGALNSSSTEYIAGSLSGQKSVNQTNSNNNLNSHSSGINWRNKKSSKNYFSSNFYVTAQNSDNTNSSDTETLLYDERLNSNWSNRDIDNSSYSLRGGLNYTRKLNDKGRSVSTELALGYNNTDGNVNQQSETVNENGDMSQQINQLSNRKSDTRNLTFGLSLSDKIGKNGYLSVGYRHRNSLDNSDKQALSFDNETRQYSIVDSLTSNTLKNNSLIHTGKLGYRNQTGKVKTYLGVDFKHTTMKSRETFPNDRSFKEDFTSISPNVNISYNSRKKYRYSLRYSMEQRIPSLLNLQDIVDNTNPLYISAGNPELKITSEHNITFSFSGSNLKKSTFKSLRLNVRIADNTVAQNRIIAENDTIILGSYYLPRGGQFSRPVNMDGQYSVNLNGTYSMPLRKLKSKLNLLSNISYSHIPNILNNEQNNARKLSASQSSTLASNISEKIDFTITSFSRYSYVDNLSGTRPNSAYFSQSTSIKLYWNFYRKFIFKVNTKQVYTGSSQSLASNSRWYVNLSLSKKMFKDNKGEITLAAYDILNDESEINRNLGDLYIMETYRRTLNKFYLLSFSYKL